VKKNAPPPAEDVPARQGSASAQPRKRKKRRPRQEITLQYFRVDAVKQHVGVRVEHQRGEPPSLSADSWLELHGRFGEPVSGVHDLWITVIPDPDAEVAPGPPPWVGAIFHT
jgi:hypothetical protein